MNDKIDINKDITIAILLKKYKINDRVYILLPLKVIKGKIINNKFNTIDHEQYSSYLDNIFINSDNIYCYSFEKDLSKLYFIHDFNKYCDKYYDSLKDSIGISCINEDNEYKTRWTKSSLMSGSKKYLYDLIVFKVYDSYLNDSLEVMKEDYNKGVVMYYHLGHYFNDEYAIAGIKYSQLSFNSKRKLYMKYLEFIKEITNIKRESIKVKKIK